ncbi:MAG: GNAT family N-acetyltransferase [Flavobacteriales bacterium]|nr:GNAT family N-acetyltransferase [Flavobacteriales bacterium]
MSALRIEPLTAEEVPHVVAYWRESTDQHLIGMGVDLEKLPPPEDIEHMLCRSLETNLEERNSYCLIWHLDGAPIGHCNTNPTLYGDEAFMHLHAWSSAKRGKGFGTEAVRLCAQRFMEDLELKHLYCSPKSDNRAANRVLEKCGFRSVKIHRTVPGSINYEQEVHLWEYVPGSIS